MKLAVVEYGLFAMETSVCVCVLVCVLVCVCLFVQSADDGCHKNHKKNEKKVGGGKQGKVATEREEQQHARTHARMVRSE